LQAFHPLRLLFPWLSTCANFIIAKTFINFLDLRGILERLIIAIVFVVITHCIGDWVATFG
jgi:hypothetical protein